MEPPGEPSGRGEGSWPPLPSEGDNDIALAVQVAMNDLSPAGPIQAVEILMESPSLAHMCRTHHAVIRRIQVPPGAGGTPSDPKVSAMEPGVQWGAFLWHHGVMDQHHWESPDLGLPGLGCPEIGAPQGLGGSLWLRVPRAQPP